jgi:hypothetical protein
MLKDHPELLPRLLPTSLILSGEPMPHATTLIATVVMGLVLAFCGGFLASSLRLPPLIGYLLAGVAVGPFTLGW